MNKLKILGKHFGYPECCIESFERTMGAVGNPKGAEAGNGTGFIPCPSCADKVNKGEIKLEELIHNRKHSLPFPNNSFRIVSKELNLSL